MDDIPGEHFPSSAFLVLFQCYCPAILTGSLRHRIASHWGCVYSALSARRYRVCQRPHGARHPLVCAASLCLAPLAALLPPDLSPPLALRPLSQWGNHMNIFADAGVPWKVRRTRISPSSSALFVGFRPRLGHLQVSLFHPPAPSLLQKYRYFDPATVGLDFAGFKADLQAAPEGSVIVLHGCAHNPTGVDPTLSQWGELEDVIVAKKHVPFFDIAYQGFASGSLDTDAASVRLFAERGIELFAAQSYRRAALTCVALTDLRGRGMIPFLVWWLTPWAIFPTPLSLQQEPGAVQRAGGGLLGGHLQQGGCRARPQPAQGEARCLSVFLWFYVRLLQ